MIGFEYPVGPHVRRHGPEGYADYESYRDWLRDEFTFRCVYCLHREEWYNRSGAFHIDHFVPASTNASGKCEYKNLLYSCATCNMAKSNILDLPDPCRVAFKEYMGFPDDLPDLRPPKKQVPGNSRPEGAENCYFAMHERGALPATY